ncbi:MAG: nitrous oxide reductase family maturation protein NosD [Saprospiraceae bacterium]|nr:nitrous oxide reductase family maturation protein NosD [Saprospiraceae bacterium]
MGSYLKIVCFSLFFCGILTAETIHVGPGKENKSIRAALFKAHHNDTIIVYHSLYREGNIVINKRIVMLGEGWPVLDGQHKYEVVSIKADSVIFSGFQIQNSGVSTMNDPGGIKVYDGIGVIIENNILENNFFGIYIQYGKNCIVRNNRIKAYGVEEQQIGNGIHCWKSDSLQIIGNQIQGHRDGIYFEFVTNSIIWRNISKNNIRYGLHFMFSNNDAYINNYFDNNGAGVAVMYTKKVVMYSNTFKNSHGDAAYGILLKDISDAEIIGNRFLDNTIALYMEGANRILIKKNVLSGNGWGMKIQSNCMDNVITENNFFANTFDVATSGTLVLNTFDRNYWDKYEGYDIDKDSYGDVPYHPLSIFSTIIENNPIAMLLYRSFMVTLMERTEKLIPSITPDIFRDNQPIMKAYNL